MPSDTTHHESATGYRNYRAPQTHGTAVIEPPIGDSGQLLETNRDRAKHYGAFFDSLRSRARRQMIDDAICYTSAYRKVDFVSYSDDTPIVMAGHQPAIFHPGVWFKNFALSRIGQDVGGIAINLAVDNDVASGSSIRVPVVDASGNATLTSVAYDQAGGGVPYEQTTIGDRSVFDQFDKNVAEVIRPLVHNPCVSEFWKHAVAAANRCGVAGCALAQARHGFEDELGLKTLELPLGVLCKSSAFAEFVLAILTELPLFVRCYNEAADHYRAAHGIRSSAHPVPNLDADNGWLEAPLWIYGNDSPKRRAAWVSIAGDQLVISDRDPNSPKEISIDVSHPKLAAEQLASKLSPNFKLRPRALLTTMYARLVLSDLFLHGIGGAKYDQLGDRIITSFFGITPPEFMVVSATIKLPGSEADSQEDAIRNLRRKFRDTYYQPERFAGEVSLDENLLARKRELLQSIPEGSKHAWHHELSGINRQLAAQLEGLRERLSRELAERQRRVASQSILASREHPFCLFPADYLAKEFGKLLV